MRPSQKPGVGGARGRTMAGAAEEASLVASKHGSKGASSSPWLLSYQLPRCARVSDDGTPLSAFLPLSRTSWPPLLLSRSATLHLADSRLSSRTVPSVRVVSRDCACSSSLRAPSARSKQPPALRVPRIPGSIDSARAGRAPAAMTCITFSIPMPSSGYLRYPDTAPYKAIMEVACAPPGSCAYSISHLVRLPPQVLDHEHPSTNSTLRQQATLPHHRNSVANPQCTSQP